MALKTIFAALAVLCIAPAAHAIDNTNSGIKCTLKKSIRVCRGADRRALLADIETLKSYLTPNDSIVDAKRMIFGGAYVCVKEANGELIGYGVPYVPDGYQRDVSRSGIISNVACYDTPAPP